MKWRGFLPSILFYCLCFAATVGVIVTLSPRNSHRPFLKEIKYVILHTTEGGTEGSLATLHKDGKIHYMISPEGKVYQIMQEERLAVHAGRSLWNGRPRIDEVSIGIEMVGFHNKPLTSNQELALRNLLFQLKQKYNIPDDNVLTHSMVAYGSPNRWQEHSHRGRKRCGMLMATSQVRRRIGLNSEPRIDPDVRANRLAVGDPYLHEFIYGEKIGKQKILTEVYSAADSNIVSAKRSAWFIARDKYDWATTTYSLPNGQKLRGNQIRDWSKLPYGTKVTLNESPQNITLESESSSGPSEIFKEIGVHGMTAFSIARSEATASTTIYFLPDTRVFSGKELYQDEKYLLSHLPKGTKILVGYQNGGMVTLEKTAYKITGKRWNLPSTIYKLADGKILTGDEVNASGIPPETYIFFER